MSENVKEKELKEVNGGSKLEDYFNVQTIVTTCDKSWDCTLNPDYCYSAHDPYHRTICPKLN